MLLIGFRFNHYLKYPNIKMKFLELIYKIFLDIFVNFLLNKVYEYYNICIKSMTLIRG